MAFLKAKKIVIKSNQSKYKYIYPIFRMLYNRFKMLCMMYFVEMTTGFVFCYVFFKI